jgi:outer membrane protein assembly factor BamB
MLKLFSLFVSIALAALAHAGENWPQFRGPTGNGISDAKDLPVTFSETENLKWKTEIHGKAWSSPVVWGKQVWMTTATPDGKELSVVCVDFDSGAIKHDIKLWDIAEPQYCIDYNSYASSTPVIEAGRLYAHFGAPGTAAIDTKTGKKIWERLDLPCNHFRGPGSSPVLVDDMLILTFDGFDYNYLVALNKNTGETVWKHDRNLEYKTDNGDYHKAYSTPQAIDVAGKKQLISPSAEATVAYDPATGEEIWRVITGGMNAATRPLFDDKNKLVFCIAPAGGINLFAVNPDGRGDITASNIAWKNGKGAGSRSSPLLLNGLLFMTSDQGVITCLDAETGKQVWQNRSSAKKTSASPVYSDGKIYFLGEDGEAPVIAAEREYKLLADNKLDSGAMASPAVVGKSLIVRSKTHLYRFETP